MRLIDADELIEHAWRDKLDSRELIAEMINRAPTIEKMPTLVIEMDMYSFVKSKFTVREVLDAIRTEIDDKIKEWEG